MLLVAGVALAALVSFLRTAGDDTAAPVTTGAETSTDRTTTAVEPQQLPTILPLSGALREEGGVLWWSDERCQAKALDLSSGTVSRLPAEHCRIWPAPSGSKVVATATNRSDALDGKGLVQFSYPPSDGDPVLGERAVLRHEPGVIASEVVWPPNEDVALACVQTRAGTVVAGVRPDPVPSPSVSLVRDSCFPAILPDGRYASVVGPASVVLDGRLLLSDAELERLLPSVPKHARRVVSALGAGDDEVVAALAAIRKGRLLPTSATLAVVSAKGKVRFSAFLRENVFPATVGLSPHGDALWYFDAADGSAHIVAVPGGRRLPPFDARWVAWSPEGDYVAVGRGRSIQILTWPDGFVVDYIPVAANVVYWTLAPGAAGPPRS